MPKTQFFTAPQTVYGVLMNHPSEHVALGAALHEAPYKAPPKAPVLYIKPSNTHVPARKALRSLALPLTHPEDTNKRLQVRPCLGLIFQKTAPQGTTAFDAADFELGLFLDFTRPQPSFYRPPVAFNALDHSLVCPEDTVPLAKFGGWAALQAAVVQCTLDFEPALEYAVAEFMRLPQALLASVSEFIGFEAGDVLLLGCPAALPAIPWPGTGVQALCAGVPPILARVFEPPVKIATTDAAEHAGGAA